jgi:hypothetical protein
MTLTFERIRDIVFLIIGVVIIQFFIGLSCYEAGRHNAPVCKQEGTYYFGDDGHIYRRAKE